MSNTANRVGSGPIYFAQIPCNILLLVFTLIRLSNDIKYSTNWYYWREGIIDRNNVSELFLRSLYIYEHTIKRWKPIYSFFSQDASGLIEQHPGRFQLNHCYKPYSEALRNSVKCPEKPSQWRLRGSWQFGMDDLDDTTLSVLVVNMVWITGGFGGVWPP